MTDALHLGQGLLPIIMVGAAGLLARLWPRQGLPITDRVLGSSVVPLLAGVATSLVVYQVWGSLDAVPIIHDEAAYLLQAQMLAQGHLVGPPRPLPQFFEQFHVFVTPVLAARYPLGFALALVPGVWLGLPGLVTVILSGLTGTMLFLLARRLSTPSVALLAWLLWAVTPGNLRFRPAYLTESLTGLLWLASWWSLLEWRRTGRRSWLLGLSLLIAWQVITRPVTAIAFTIPVAVVVLVTTFRTGRWADLALGMVLGLACLSVLPYQNFVTTGNWRVTPLSEYSRVYFPFDLPGFGLDSTPPHRDLPADFQAFAARFAPMHREFVPRRLPVILVDRTALTLLDAWGRWWPSFAILALLGLLAGGAELQFGALTLLVLLLSYLTFAHDERWMVYYLEGEPVLLVLVAVGAQRLLQLAGGGAALDRPSRVEAGLLLLGLAAAATWPGAIQDARGTVRYVNFEQARFARRVAQLPGQVIVFIRYGPAHDFNHSLIANEPDLERAHAWLVYDRGDENAQLMSLAPGRTPWRYEEDRRRFVQLPPAGAAR